MFDNAFRNRTLELLDAVDIPTKDLYQNLKELDVINTYLGGHAITISGVKKIIAAYPNKTKWTILDIACGGGDNIKALKKWASRQKKEIVFFGLDIKPACIEYASNQLGTGVIFLQMDFNELVAQDLSFDICTTALFAHHLFEEDLDNLVTILNQKSDYGYVINDLHRHYLAFHSIKILTRLFSKSYLVKNDACLSVARGFKKAELQILFQRLQISNFKIYWRWAFRWLIVGIKKEDYEV
jgi:2-polyprenyl-3-methyl-5-hydroxy-6-metoxy-1,4-benzoquinol methylase